MDSQRYMILAKGEVSDGPAEYLRRNDQQRKGEAASVRKRLQALLASRFQLAVHTETRQLPIYALVMAKNGPKLQPNLSPDGTIQNMSTGHAMFKGYRASMDAIAQGLAGLTGRPVRDETGLKGFYDFSLAWTPDAPSSPRWRPREASRRHSRADPVHSFAGATGPQARSQEGTRRNSRYPGTERRGFVSFVHRELQRDTILPGTRRTPRRQVGSVVCGGRWAEYRLRADGIWG